MAPAAALPYGLGSGVEGLPHERYDLVIVGAGISGGVIAERAAAELGLVRPRPWPTWPPAPRALPGSAAAGPGSQGRPGARGGRPAPQAGPHPLGTSPAPPPAPHGRRGRARRPEGDRAGG